MAQRKVKIPGVDPSKAITFVTKNIATGETHTGTITGKTRLAALSEINKRNKAADGKFVSWAI